MLVELRGYCGDPSGWRKKFPAAEIGDKERFGERGGEPENILRTFSVLLTSLNITIRTSLSIV
jgi:hypothetical protein